LDHFTFAILVPMNYRDYFFAVFLAVLLSIATPNHLRAQFTNSSADTTIYVLTCSPGADLYSVFGHTALMVKTPQSDWVYNYGTFDFNTPNFYLKFSRGQLAYKLAKEQFGYFQYSYIREQRQIMAQELNLTAAEKTNLIALLEENALPENAEYKYNFFTDNCSTRVRDIVNKACGNNIEWNTAENGLSFREMIQVYLKDMEWSDLGIDVALGLPCDRAVLQNQQAFLPDSMYGMFSAAQLNAKPLVKNTFEVLPAEKITFNKTLKDRTLPVIGIISGFLLAMLFMIKSHGFRKILSSFILLCNGLIGLLVFLLWFFTDHVDTANNLNILWANPLNLVLPFIKSVKMKWLKLFSVISLLTLTLWVFLPQDLHESLLPFTVLSIAAAWVKLRLLKI